MSDEAPGEDEARRRRRQGLDARRVRQAEPGREGRRRTRRPLPDQALPAELEALAIDAGRGRLARRRRRGDDLKLTNLDKVLFGPPPSDPEAAAGDEARADRLLRPDRADDAAPPRRAAAQPPALPERRRGPGLLAEGHPGDRADVAPALARDRRRGSQGERAPDRRPGRDAVLARQPGRLRDPRLDVAARGPVTADVRADRHRPRARRRPGRRRSSSPGSTGRRSRISACAATRRRPASAGSRSGSRSSRATRSATRATGSSGSAGRSGRRCRISCRGTGRRRAAAARPASTTPRTPRSRRSSRRTPSGPSAGAPVSAPIAWDELDDPDLRPDRWTIRTIVERVEEVGDLFAGAQTDSQVLPPV